MALLCGVYCVIVCFLFLFCLCISAVNSKPFMEDQSFAAGYTQQTLDYTSKYSQWASDNHLNKWIVLGRISYETGMHKFRNDESRKIN